MLRLDLTLEDNAENLALDEALLENAELEGGREVLRFWESAKPMVVLGRSSPIESEVNLGYCRENEIEVMRRCSGGATVVAGEQCLMYALLLSYEQRPQMRMLDFTHEMVMGRVGDAIRSLGIEVSMQGTCDLTLENRKFSGNALRCKRSWLIYHGTILCEDFDLSSISKCLETPKRQPEYRKGRNHSDFLTVIPKSTSAVKEAIAAQWQAEERMENWPLELTSKLSREKYRQSEWTRKV